MVFLSRMCVRLTYKQTRLVIFSYSTLFFTRKTANLLNCCLQGGVTKRCRLSWLTNSAIVYEPKCGGVGLGCGVSANEYSCAHRPQIKFGDLTPYLTCGADECLPHATVIFSFLPISHHSPFYVHNLSFMWCLHIIHTE